MKSPVNKSTNRSAPDKRAASPPAHSSEVARVVGGGLEAWSTSSQAADLLNQQIWCWGRDIECSGGNLLVQYGFQRIEKPAHSHAASLYRLDMSPTARVVLRGFGVFYGEDGRGGLFLRRDSFAPQLTPKGDLSKPAWTIDDLPRFATPRPVDVPRCQRLLLEVVNWIREYEVWVGEQAGIAYRRKTLVPWNAKHKTVVCAEEMAGAWRMLGLAVAEHPERLITTCGGLPRR